MALSVARIGDGDAHYDLRTIYGVIEPHREGTLHKGHGFLVYPIQPGTLYYFGLHQLSPIGDDCFDQNFERA
jgi:hypothetical protein